MGIFASMFPGITGFDETQEPVFRKAFMSSPPEVQQWLMGNIGTLRKARGPFQTIMQDMLAKAPPAVQQWASSQHFGGAAPPARTRSIAPAAAPAGPIAAASGSNPYDALEQKFGLPPGYLARTAGIESGGNPRAHNPSGATGVFQFMPETARAYHIDPRDPSASAEGAARLAADNARHLSKVLGRAPTAGELYLAHQQGAGGAAGLLAHPDAPAASIIGRAALLANGGRADMTAGQFAAMWTGRFGHGASAPPGPPQTSNPDAALVSAAKMVPVGNIPWVNGPGGAPIHAPETPIATAAGGAPGAAPGGLGGMFGGMGGGGGIHIPVNPPHEIQPSPPLEAALAAQEANQRARQMVDFLLPVEDQTTTSGQPPPNLFGDAAADPAAAEGVFQRIFAKPKLAENPGGIRYRA